MLFLKKKLLLLFLVPVIAFSQTAKLTSKEQIIALKKGVLLVRLKTSQNQIDALNKAGNKEAAEAIADKQNDENRKIVKAFNFAFSFCPVYFFYSSCSASIKQKNFSGCILNSQMEVDNSISINDLYVLTAEFDFSELIIYAIIV